MISIATNEDFEQIESWLKAEYEQLQEGFWVNRSHIKRAYEEGRLMVFRRNGEAVAFHSHAVNLQTDSIFVVRPDMRGCGIGLALARHIIDNAKATDACLIHISCAPASSLPFWEKLGFGRIRNDERSGALESFLPLDKTLVLPAEGNIVSVVIQFFSEDAGAPLLSEHRPQAKRLGDGSIALGERVIGFDQSLTADIRVSVEVDGKLLFPPDRAKYREHYGFTRRDGAFFLDRILNPDTLAGT